MAKILQFRLLEPTAAGSVEFEIPVKRENPPRLPQKEAIIHSIMPDKQFPAGHTDLRPLLQRDGLILMSWAIWEDWYNDGSLLRRYIVTWITSNGKANHYATGPISENELAQALPERRAAPLFYRGVYSRNYDIHYVSSHEIADYLYLAAPFDLDGKTVPGFMRVLKSCGATADFDVKFSLGKAKKSLAQEYLDELAGTQVANAL
jgi:hypothetical protein